MGFTFLALKAKLRERLPIAVLGAIYLLCFNYWKKEKRVPALVSYESEPGSLHLNAAYVGPA